MKNQIILSSGSIRNYGMDRVFEIAARCGAEVALDPAERAGGSRDFVLRYRLAGAEIASGLLLYEGEDENFFLMMVQPPPRPAAELIPPREYVFIVDVSGSMSGFPLDTSKQLMRSLVGRLRPDEQNLFTGIRSEFAEELGLQASDLTELICVGVVADETWGRLNFEFVFLARTRLTARQTIERARTAKSAEHFQLEPFPWYGQLLPDLLLADPNGFVPTGWAGIVLCLWHVFGSTIIPEWVTVHRSYEEHMGHRLAMAQL